MKPELKILPVKSSGGFITNVDVPDLPESHVYRRRGGRSEPGYIFVRDFGTVHRYISYPTTNLTPSTVTLISGTSFYDNVEKRTYDLVVGLDKDNKTRIYLGTPTGTWVEMTRKLTAQMNGAPAGATITIDNIQENGIALGRNLTLNEVQNWIVVNTSKTSATATVSAAATNGAGSPVWRLTISADIFTTGDVILVDGILGATAANGVSHVTRISATQIDLDDRPFYAGHTYTSGGAVKIAASTAFAISNTTSDVLTLYEVVTSAGLNWKDNETLSLYKGTAYYKEDDLTNGTTPTIGFLPIEQQRKASIFIGDSSSPQVVRKPIQIVNAAATNLFFDGTSAFYLSRAAGTFVERGFGLNPSFVDVGTPYVPIQPVSASATRYINTQVYDDNSSDPFCEIEARILDFVAVTTPVKIGLSVAVCFEYYGGYMVSEPVYRIFAKSFNSANFLQIQFVFRLQYSKMHKGVTGIRLYVSDDYNGVNPAPDSSFLHYGTLSFTTTNIAWAKNNLDTGITSTVVDSVFGSTFYGEGVGAGQPLDVALGHNVDITRETVKPRYAVKMARDSQALVVVDRDDNTLAVSCVGGAGVVMDEAFSTIDRDISNNRQNIYLNSRGKLYGLAATGIVADLTGLPTGQLVAFKRSELEFFDFINGDQNTIEGDCVSSSIAPCPKGIVFAGNSALRIIPRSTVTTEILNFDWLNLYNGTLRTNDNSAPLISESARQNAFLYYSPYHDSLFVQLLMKHPETNVDGYVSFQYSFSEKKWIGERTFNVGTGSELGRIRFTTITNEGKLSLGFARGLLLYPNAEGTFRFQDDVTIA